MSRPNHRPLPDIIGNLRSVRDYFERFRPEDPLFEPELDRADESLALIDTGAIDTPPPAPW